MREQIVEEIRAIHPLDTLEKRHLADALTWIDAGEPIFRIAKPATPPKHLVSYFVCISDVAVLLVDHRNAGLWLPTGGHVEPDEHPRQTVVRELREELGLGIASDKVKSPLFLTVSETVGATAGHTDVSLWYVLPIDPNAAMKFDEHEFRDVRWFEFDKIPFERSDPHMRRFIAKLRTIG